MHNLLIISLITIYRMDCGIFVIKFMQLWSNDGFFLQLQMYYIVLNKIFFIFYDREFSLILYYILFCTGQGHKVQGKTPNTTDNVSRK